MPRKLKIELDVDTSKAKKKIEEAVGTPGATGTPSASGAGASVSTAAPAAVPAAERAARSIEKLGESAAGAQVNLRSAGKAFAGMAVGIMGTSFFES